MKFQIKDSSGKSQFITEYAECIPFEDLESMESAGLRFFVDGKRVTRKDLKPLLKSVVDDMIEEMEIASKSSSPKDTTILKEPEAIQLDFPITNRTIICVNTGKYYKNQKEASEDMHIDPSCISDCITKGKAYKGYTFKRVVDLK